MESLTIPYFIVKGEFLMVVKFAVILAVACLVACCVRRRNVRTDGLSREDVTEEELARIMPGEYSQYKRVFENQAHSEFVTMMPHI